MEVGGRRRGVGGSDSRHSVKQNLSPGGSPQGIGRLSSGFLMRREQGDAQLSPHEKSRRQTAYGSWITDCVRFGHPQARSELEL